MPTQPGWYYQVGEDRVRYWDGESWRDEEGNGHAAGALVPAPSATQELTGRHGKGHRARAGLLIATCVALVATGAVGGAAALTVLNTKNAATALTAAGQNGNATRSPAPITAVPSSAGSTPPAPTTHAPMTPNKPATPPKPAASVKATRPSPTTTRRPAPAVTQRAPVPAPTTADAFDKAYARIVAKNIVEDIATADERFTDSPEIGASSTMNFLSADMGRLLDAGLPPVKDEAHYYALVTTLEDFYGKAATQLPDDVLGAAATYTVARERTAELLGLLNPVLGTKHALPEWSFE